MRIQDANAMSGSEHKSMTIRNPVTIYLDTMVWNELCDQHVDPETINAALTAQNGVLVFSEYIVYELAKTYMSAEPNAVERGRELLSYLQRYLNDTLCIKKPIELVA